MKVSVSILIPIRNEAGNLPRSLASVAWADEVIVVDSGSTDGSREIARKAGAQVVQFCFNGVWPKKKNWALENIPFRNEWVFILDADEVLSSGTAEEVQGIISNEGRGCAGYWINRRFMFMNQWLKHAYYPNWNLRLFRHRLGRYEQIVQGATDSGDNEVHEHIIVQGATGRMKSEMDHYAFPSIGVFIEKHNRYSNWEARLQVEGERGGTRQTTQPQAWRIRTARRIKRLSHHLPFRPTLRFLYVYLWQGGIWDGRAGYNFARLHGIYEFMSVAKAQEIRLQINAPKSSVQVDPKQAAVGCKSAVSVSGS
ncbi:MAG TPA: glycosyltransferase family 2 protein [Lacunisphaera sp.]|jgi:glycosyltransferase involved in cell wall biosynthesis